MDHAQLNDPAYWEISSHSRDPATGQSVVNFGVRAWPMLAPDVPPLHRVADVQSIIRLTARGGVLTSLYGSHITTAGASALSTPI